MGFRFREFPIYQQLRVFIKEIYILANQFPVSEKFGLASQLRRAATSILLNLAEGTLRKSDAELNRFILISIGSIGEVVAILDISLDLKYISLSVHHDYVLKCESIAKQFYGFSRSLNLTKKLKTIKLKTIKLKTKD